MRYSPIRGFAACAVVAMFGALHAMSPTAIFADQESSPPAVSAESVSILAPKSSVEIAERFAKVFEFKARVEDVYGFDPAVISIKAIAPDRLFVSAIGQGVTTIVVVDEAKNSFEIEVFVTGDARLLQSVLKRTFPETSVTAIKVRDSVLLRGWVTEPQQITQIVEVAELYFPRVLNQMKLGGPQQVQLRAKVMEVQRSKIRRMGVNLAYSGRSASFASTPGLIAPLSGLDIPMGGPTGTSLASTGFRNANLAFGFVRNDLAFGGLIEALKEEGLLKIQAEPTLVTRNGAPAKLINGGDFPIPVPQSLGTITIEWREYGVTLESTPIVMSPTRVQQQLKVEISELDFTRAITIQGTTIPAISKRNEETTVDMDFGQTLVIGGLINTRKTGQSFKTPFLGELPLIGAAFRRVRYEEVETEVVVLITPEYVDAMRSDQVPSGGPGLQTTSPIDRELYRDGVLEIPNYGEPCENGNCMPAGAIPGGPIPDSAMYAPSHQPPLGQGLMPGPGPQNGGVPMPHGGDGRYPSQGMPPSPMQQPYADPGLIGPGGPQQMPPGVPTTRRSAKSSNIAPASGSRRSDKSASSGNRTADLQRVVPSDPPPGRGGLGLIEPKQPSQREAEPKSTTRR